MSKWKCRFLPSPSLSSEPVCLRRALRIPLLTPACPSPSTREEGTRGTEEGNQLLAPQRGCFKMQSDNLGTTLPMGSDHEPDLRAEGPRAGAREPCSVWGGHPKTRYRRHSQA